MNKDERRIRFAPHLFEIKSGLMLTEKNLGALKKAIDDCTARKHEVFIFMERHFELGYAQFCVEKFENIDPSFDEKALEWEAKKKEQENNYGNISRKMRRKNARK